MNSRRTNKIDFLLLFLLALLVQGLVTILIRHPGYMDAAYSYDIAQQLLQGQGFNEPFLWNYLDNPAGLPHASHLYWMPLPTVLAWLGLLGPGDGYPAARLPFIVVFALLPLISYWLAATVTGRRFEGWLAGLLTIFSGFYLPYWAHTDNFTPFAVAGSLSLIAVWKAAHPGIPRVRVLVWGLASGALVGLAHLSRADGLLLLIAIVLWLIWHELRVSTLPPSLRPTPPPTPLGHLLLVMLPVLVGYLLIMLPWFARNLAAAGTPLPATGTQSMWLHSYDDLFAYGREFTLGSYLAWGWANILRSKWEALLLNAQNVLAVLNMVFLLPLALIGIWRLLKNSLYQLVVLYAGLLLIAMTFVFTFPGPRGGLFHSGGALLPFVFTAALVGLEAVVDWVAARRKGWNARRARQVLGAGLILLALLVSGFVYYRAVVVNTRWREPNQSYTRLGQWLDAQDQTGELVMVGDPPGYWYSQQGPSLAIPNEPMDSVLAAADRYGARFLVLDQNRPAPLAALYSGEESHPRLHAVHQFQDETGQPVLVLQISVPE